MGRETTFRRIGVADAAELLARADVVVLDVRDADAYARARIGSARRIADADLPEVLAVTPKDRPVLIYCYHGNASRLYARIFADFGFRDVYSLDGGFEHWRDAQAGADRFI